MSSRVLLFLVLGLDTLILLLQINELSISYSEASLLYGEFSFLQQIIKTSIYIFGQNDFGLRVPMIIMHLLSAVLLYKISKNYLKVYENRVWLTLVFILLPGVVGSALVINEAGVAIFLLLLFIFVYEKKMQKSVYVLLLLYMLIDGHFVYLFISLLFYSFYKKERYFLFYNLFLSISSLFLYGINLHGSPKGYFLDSFGLYSAVFSPLVFIYIIYVLYRKYLTKEISLLWFMATNAFIVSLLLSFRQKIGIEYFAPYLIVALPLAAQVFEHSYRVRLSVFRKNYRVMFFVALLFLFLNTFIVVFNKHLYEILDKPKKHFSYKFHIAKELAQKLKNRNIYCVSTDLKMQKRLEFYGVTKCNSTVLEEIKQDEIKKDSVTISYANRIVYTANVTNININ